MTRLNSTIATGLLLSIFSSSPIFASGSYGGNSGSYNRSTAPQKQIDQNYEIGKSIYTGRKSSAGKLKYCIDVEGTLTPLRRSSLQAHKRTSYDEFSNSLVNCDAPEKKIAQQLSKDELLYVLYYLNKRFKLYLS